MDTVNQAEAQATECLLYAMSLCFVIEDYVNNNFIC